MKIIADKNEMRAWSLAQKCAGHSVGFAPTMGALHEGHLSLVREAVKRDDVSVMSIFVNPAQFAPHEDFNQYPRTFEDDAGQAEALGVDVVYAPRTDDMYPPDYSTYVTVEQVSDGLCSITRPHFFRGVATVVAKLFNVVLPDRAYFGQKDAQQCAVIKRMVRDLDMPVEIVEMPIIREPDGLAMSSRNQYLTETDRPRALALSRAVFRAQAMLEAGARDVATIIAAVREAMADVDIDYIALVDAETIQPVERIEGPITLAVAANVGAARLLDNIKFTPPQQG